MDTKDFLKLILPEQGLYIAAMFPKGMKRAPSHKVVETTDQLAKLVLWADRKHFPVYHACASYEHAEGVWDERKQKMRLRVVSNTYFVRAQWLDIDVGPGKDYATRKEALTALRDMCKALKIPLPLIVGSGPEGLHCYWVFTSDIPASEAASSAGAFSSALKSVGFKHDTTRTQDLASVLRPVGTHHRKGDPVEVEVLREAKPINYAKFTARFDKFRAPVAPVIKGVQEDDWGSGTGEFPPSSAKLIARRCGALREVGKVKGDVEEPYWRAMLGLLKYTIEGEPLAHKWSTGSSSYSEEETQEKLDGWVHGPTTCDTFSRYSKRCDNCPLRGKQASPISLGYSEDAPPPTKPAKKKALVNQPVDHYAKLIPDRDTMNVPFWPRGYSWNGEQLLAFHKDTDGGGEWVPFSDTLYYPFLRYETEDKTRAMKVCALTDPVRNIWRTFDVETKMAADSRTLATALGAHEVVYMPKSKDRNLKFVQDVLHGIRDQGIETTTYNTFGWHGKGFVLGDVMVLNKGQAPIFLGSKVPEDLSGSFGLKGTALEWADLINTIYNRTGAEPYQFIICASFASILIRLCDADMWHGIPIGLTGPGGLGKTTTCKVAVSAFGDPKKMTIQANDEGTTMNALIQRVGTMRNLPLVLDEITGRETSELQAMLFALSNGKPKLRLRPDGTEINPGQSWDTITFITGNLSITKMLADSDRVKADATQVRCFEIPLDEGFNDRVFKDINAKDLIEHQLLAKQYGEVGRIFIRACLKNREKIANRLQRHRASFAGRVDTESRERFYYDLIATVLEAADLAKQLGLIHFDVKKLRRWALDHVTRLRSVRSHSLDTPEDYLQAFLSYLYQHTITTKYYRDGREKLPGTENVIAPMREPLARHATEDRRFIVTLKAFNNWCATQKVNPTWLRHGLEASGHMLPMTDENERQRICKGSGLDGIQARCIEFNYDMLDDKKLVIPEFIKGVVKGKKDPS